MLPRDPTKSKYGRDLRVWTILGQLRDEVVRDIAARLREGQTYDDISDAVGIRRSTGRRKCAEIAQALDIPVEESRHVVFAREVAALVEEGLTDGEIAEQLGRTIDSVAAARHRALGPKYKVVRLTPDEHATIDRMILEGFNQYEIAREVGCNQTLVSIRAKKLDLSKVEHVRPPCDCGKPAGHGGRCNLVVDPAFIRERLLAGFTAADIARECGRTAQSFKPKYVQPVIDQLTAEGHRCACGDPFGHQFVCSTTMAVQRRTFTEDQHKKATEMVRDGAAVRAVCEALKITVNSGNMIVAQARASLAEQGVACPCGKPIDHGRTCSARNGSLKGKPYFKFTSAAAQSMTREMRRKISSLARAGHGGTVISAKTGASKWKVEQLLAELAAAGALPAKCASCEGPFGHRGMCRVPERCKCGRWRHHRGPCRSKTPRKTVGNGGKPPAIDPKLRREAMLRYRDGDSIYKISAATGIPWSQVQRLVTYWRNKSPYEQKPCVCGRPARHPGGCIKNTPHAVGKLEKKRIVDAVRAGEMPHRIAERLGLNAETVRKHSAATREEMCRAGVTCDCGRPFGHPDWCSVKWDAYDQPRGRRPFPEPQETQAIEALVRGDVVADIAKAVGVSPGSIWRLRLALTDEQRAQRTLAIRDRIARKAQGGADLMERIRTAVPKHIDGAVRDDIIGEIYLAVIEGRVEAEQIKAVVRSFVSRGLSQWQSAYGPRSLDETLPGDGNRTLADRLGDSTATLALEEITIGDDA